jgi:DNA-directed RNA polymerase subunit omega
MLYPSINELKKKTSSGYALCILASKRSRDLIDGKPALTDDAPSNRPVSIAAQEIYEDLIGYHEDGPAEAGGHEVYEECKGEEAEAEQAGTGTEPDWAEAGTGAEPVDAEDEPDLEITGETAEETIGE